MIYDNIEDWVIFVGGIGCGHPIPLAKIDHRDLPRYFFYDRDYGMFICGIGMHQVLMAEFSAWKAGFEESDDYADSLGIDTSCTTMYQEIVDHYLSTTKGTCFMSGVPSYGKPQVRTWKPGYLNDDEIDVFGKPTFLGC